MPFDKWYIDDIDTYFEDYDSISRSDSKCFLPQKAEEVAQELKMYNDADILHLETNCPLFTGMFKDPFYTEVLNKKLKIFKLKAVKKNGSGCVFS